MSVRSGSEATRRPLRTRSTDAVALLAAWIAPIVATVVATPFVLDRIGAAEYGLFAVVLGLVVSMASLGMSRPLAVSTAGGGRDGVRRAVLWGLGLAIGGSLALAAVAWLVPLDWLVGGDVDAGHARVAVLAGGVAVLGTALMSTASGRVIGTSRFVAVGSITAAIGVATSVGYITLASLGGTAVALVLWNGVATCVGAYLFVRAGRVRGRPPPDSGPRLADPPSMWPFVIVQVAGNLAIVIERTALAATTGLDEVTEFVVPHTMVLTLHGGLLWLTAPLLTRAVHLLRSGDDTGLAGMYQAASRLGVTVAAFGGISLAIVGHGALDRWLDGNSVMSPTPFLILTVYAVGLPLTVVPWNIADATGHARVNAEVAIIWLAMVVVGGIGTRWWGLDATVAARAALVLTLPVYIRRVEDRALGGARPWTVAWVARLLGAAGVAAAVEWVLWTGLDRSIPAAAAAVAGGLVVFVVLIPRTMRETTAAAMRSTGP